MSDVENVDLANVPEEMIQEAYEVLLATCIEKLAETTQFSVYQEHAVNQACGYIAAVIRSQMKPDYWEESSIEPHRVCLRLLLAYNRAYNGLNPDGTPDKYILTGTQPSRPKPEQETAD